MKSNSKNPNDSIEIKSDELGWIVNKHGIPVATKLVWAEKEDNSYLLWSVIPTWFVIVAGPVANIDPYSAYHWL